MHIHNLLVNDKLISYALILFLGVVFRDTKCALQCISVFIYGNTRTGLYIKN